jgi:hypothetical protein
MLLTKFGDHPSISSVGEDFKGYSILALETPKRGQSKYISKLDKKNYPTMLQTKFGYHPSISSLEIDI